MPENLKNCVAFLALAFGLLIPAFLSCSNDIETVKALTEEQNYPDQSGYNIETTYTDSGRLQGRLTAPEVQKYSRKEEPYTEFPKGLKVTFYDSIGRPYAYIQARYAIFYESRQLWEARREVIAENPLKGEKLETEQMFWNQKDRLIYSDKFTRLTNADGDFVGEGGFEAEQDLSRWKLKGSSGTVNVRDDLNAEPE
jgi:LPS export ABC transporter protein LptC